MPVDERKYRVERHDLSDDRSLRAWSAADEYLLSAFAELEKKPSHLAIYNDRFGFLGCHLHAFAPTLLLTHKSQEKAITANFKANGLALPKFSNPLLPIENKMDFALMKVPKSLGLFRLFLEQIMHNSADEITVICAFMTRHFSPKMLEIAGEYFDVVEQSKAVKKARLLTISKKRNPAKKEIVSTLNYNDHVYQQYLGVFSADHIDYATQYFLDHLEVQNTDQRILDLASGNGIIGHEILRQHPDVEMHLMDDSYLAVASAELNVKGDRVHHHCNNELSIFDEDSFDLIVTNPPFHFEHEINIQVTLALFRDCFRCLKEGGNLQLVANQHLNYKTHLEPLFSSVQVMAEDKRFVVYKCTK